MNDKVGGEITNVALTGVVFLAQGTRFPAWGAEMVSNFGERRVGSRHPFPGWGNRNGFDLRGMARALVPLASMEGEWGQTDDDTPNRTFGARPSGEGETDPIWGPCALPGGLRASVRQPSTRPQGRH